MSTETTPTPILLTVQQVCELTQLSDSTIRRAIKDGKLAASRPGYGARNLRITRAAVDAWIASTSTTQTTR